MVPCTPNSVWSLKRAFFLPESLLISFKKLFHKSFCLQVFLPQLHREEINVSSQPFSLVCWILFLSFKEKGSADSITIRSRSSSWSQGIYCLVSIQTANKTTDKLNHFLNAGCRIPDRTLSYIIASKSVDQRVLCCSKTLINGFVSS